METNRQPTKLMVTILGSPYSEYLINYTDNLAKKLNISWLALYVKPPRTIPHEEQILLEKNFQIIEKLNAELLTIESENIFEAIALTAKQNNVNQIIMGRALNKSKIKNWFNDPQRKILDIYPDVDIITINTESKIEQSKFYNQSSFWKWELDKKKIPSSIFSLLFFTTINLLLVDIIDYRSLGMIFLMGITISATLFKNYSTLIGSTLSALIWNFFFIPPRYTFHTYSKEDWAMLITFLVIAFIVGNYTRKLKDKESMLLLENINKNKLYELLKTLSMGKNLKETLEQAQKIILDKFNIKSKITVNHRKLELNNHLNNDNDCPEYFSFVLDNTDQTLGSIDLEKSIFEQLSIEDRLFIDSIIQQVKISIDKDYSLFEIEQINFKKESEKLFQALLSSVSHELRTPLSAIKGFASALTNPVIGQSIETQREIGTEIIDGVERLDGLVQNLLDMSRIDSGHLQLRKSEIDPSDLINSSILKNKKRFPERIIDFVPSTNYSFIIGDFVLLQQSIENIIRNSCLYTQGKIIIRTNINSKNIIIQIDDEGPGIKNLEHVFDKFYREAPSIPGGIGIGLNLCQSIIELHQGKITAQNLKPIGARFEITLPKVDYDKSI